MHFDSACEAGVKIDSLGMSYHTDRVDSSKLFFIVSQNMIYRRVKVQISNEIKWWDLEIFWRQRPVADCWGNDLYTENSSDVAAPSECK